MCGDNIHMVSVCVVTTYGEWVCADDMVSVCVVMLYDEWVCGDILR